MARYKKIMHPLTAASNRHDTSGCFVTTDVSLSRGFLSAADVFAVTGIVHLERLPRNEETADGRAPTAPVEAVVRRKNVGFENGFARGMEVVIG